MMCSLNIATQVCVVLKFVLSKVIARFRAKVMLQDAIGMRSQLKNFHFMQCKAQIHTCYTNIKWKFSQLKFYSGCLRALLLVV